MLKRTGAFFFVLNLSFLFAHLKVTYANENSHQARQKKLDFKKGEERLKVLENAGLDQAASNSGPKLSWELLMILFQNWQKIVGEILGKLRLILGLPTP